jgi:pantoate--beta-alanine ligase
MPIATKILSLHSLNYDSDLKNFQTKQQLSQYLITLKQDAKSIGFVPTMGALHKGHLSLVEKALEDNNVVVVSIFVNPTQFDKKEDLDKYPRTLNRDLALLETVSESKIFVYTPSVTDIYDASVVSEAYQFNGLEHEMEGAFRPGHFNGVGTIVKRLFDIVKPDRAYFGQKDFQQLRIIEKLVELNDMPIKIIGCPIFREKDGLAMSSRNERLKPTYRVAAPFIFKTLLEAKQKFGTKSAKKVTEWVEKQFEKEALLKLEYFIIADVCTLKPLKRKSNDKMYRAFIAVYADDIRLIDNIALN